MKVQEPDSPNPPQPHLTKMVANPPTPAPHPTCQIQPLPLFAGGVFVQNLGPQSQTSTIKESAQSAPSSLLPSSGFHQRLSIKGFRVFNSNLDPCSLGENVPMKTRHSSIFGPAVLSFPPIRLSVYRKPFFVALYLRERRSIEMIT